MTSSIKDTKLARVVREGLPEEVTQSSQLLVASDINPYQFILSRTEIFIDLKR